MKLHQNYRVTKEEQKLLRIHIKQLKKFFSLNKFNITVKIGGWKLKPEDSGVIIIWEKVLNVAIIVVHHSRLKALTFHNLCHEFVHLVFGWQDKDKKEDLVEDINKVILRHIKKYGLNRR